MKLSPDQVERVQEHVDCEAVPEGHAAAPQLETLFGQHTFFLNSEGLAIVEPSPDDDQVGNVVKLASWTDDRHTTLAPHPPEPTPVAIEFGPAGEPDEDED